MITLSKEEKLRKFFENQIRQLLLLLSLSSVFYIGYGFIDVPHGKWLNLTTKEWFVTALLVPFIHQIYVWFCWRIELYYKKISSIFGERGYKLYSHLFGILVITRFFTLIAVCISDYDSLYIPGFIKYTTAVILLVPALYAIYSVLRYFDIKRIPGEDHFKPQEYKKKPFVKKGMYEDSSNVMYVYVGLIFVGLAVLHSSKAALLITIYSYTAVWIHYFCTEKPDINYIYGD